MSSRPLQSPDAAQPLHGASGSPASRREGWIDAGKGVGILLVVYGHAVDGLRSADLVAPDSASATIFYAIYTFHMALFFLLSGLLVAHRVERDRQRFVRRLLPSIAWPYLLWSVIQVTIIYLAGAYVNQPISAFSLHTYLNILHQPPSQFWFLYVLFFLHLAAALLVRRQLPIAVPLALAALLYVLPELTGIRGKLLDMFGHFSLFYVLGVVLGTHIGRIRQWLMEAPFLKAGLAALIWLGGVALGLRADIDYWAAIHLPTALAGTVLTLVLVAHSQGKLATLLEYLGQRAMAIYVLHVLFVAGSRIVITRLTGIDSGVALVPLLTVIGVLGPLLALSISERLGLAAVLGLGTPPARAKPKHG